MAKGRASNRQNHSRISETQISTESGLTLRIEGSILTLLSGSTEQSRVDLARPEILDFEYMQHLDLLLKARHSEASRLRILHAGAGACALPLHWGTVLVEPTQVAVDTDGQMLRALKDLRVIPPRMQIKLRQGDARTVLEGSNATYDILVRDAFAGDVTPGPLTTLEWHELVASRLRPDGTYLANVAHGPTRDSSPGSTTSKEDVAATLTIFPSAVAIADRKVWRGVRRGNIAIAAWNEGDCDRDFLEREVRRLPLPVAILSRSEIESWLGGQLPARD